MITFLHRMEAGAERVCRIAPTRLLQYQYIAGELTRGKVNETRRIDRDRLEPNYAGQMAPEAEPFISHKTDHPPGFHLIGALLLGAVEVGVKGLHAVVMADHHQ